MNRLSVSPVPYAIEFLCICCAKLLVRFSFSLFFCDAVRLCRPSPHNVDQVVERMVDFVGKGQQLGGRWLNLSARFAIVSVLALNVTNVAFMAVYSYFCVKGWCLCFLRKGLTFQLFAGSSYINQLIAKSQNPNLQELAD
jgi:hypothetical protein